MTEASNVMSPDASPGEVTKKSGVRRVNNLPLYIVLTVVGLFVLVMALVAADRAAQQNTEYDKGKDLAGNTSMFAKEIAGDRTSGIIEPNRPQIPTEPVLIARPTDLDTPPAPPTNDAPKETLIDEEANRIRMAKMQMLQEAAKAKTGVQAMAPRSSGSALGGNIESSPKTREEMLARLAEVRQRLDANRTSDPDAAYKARLAHIREMGIGGGDSLDDAPALIHTAESGKDYSQFDGIGDRWRLDSKPEKPRTPYELRAGFVVPATLISGINSDLPGQIIGQVAQSVYDTPTGRHILVPQGSRLVGAYSSDVAYGQARVLVAWQRIVFPDGKAMDIGSMPGSDSAGYAGFNDQVNNHYFRVFGSALLMSAITAGVSLSQNNTGSLSSALGQQSASSALSQALGQQLGQATAQLLSKNMNIAPTLEIRPGYRFNVIVTKDLTFSKPYQSFDY